ncbi:MAG TPA: DUF1697 domain-containing protein [Rhodoferax sp.]|nr:DUF1697 domain-containing protein [Rhodoferax sp.]HPW31168.1 DUF1697 domain-containing protein [Rhodoferax sp.]
MPRFVAFFRGINVGKAKRIAMADLRALLASSSLGYQNVQTLLNSGNAVFDGPASTSAAQHALRIRAAVASELGVDALVIVKSAKDIAAVVAGNKLAAIATDPSHLLVALTHDAKSLAALASLAQTDWGAEQVHVGPHAAYVWCANGILESKAAVALLKVLASSGTTRNWATVEKLHHMLKAAS